MNYPFPIIKNRQSRRSRVPMSDKLLEQDKSTETEIKEKVMVDEVTQEETPREEIKEPVPQPVEFKPPAAAVKQVAATLERAKLPNTAQSLTQEQFERAYSAKAGLTGKALGEFILTGRNAKAQIAAAKPAPKPKAAAAKADGEKKERPDLQYKIEYFGPRGGWVFYGQRADLTKAKATIVRRSPVFPDRVWRVVDSRDGGKVVHGGKLPAKAKATAAAKAA